MVYRVYEVVHWKSQAFTIRPLTEHKTKSKVTEPIFAVNCLVFFYVIRGFSNYWVNHNGNQKLTPLNLISRSQTISEKTLQL